MHSTHLRCLAFLLCALAWSCGEAGTPDSEITAGPAGFCDLVEPRVAAFLARADADHPTPDDPRYGGTVVVSTGAEMPGGVNGFAVEDYGAAQHQQFVGLMTLLRYDADLEFQPYLARAWEISPDTSRITFHLRDDVYWHDGERTDAYDVAFTYRRVTDPETAFLNASYFDHYVRGAEGVEVVDSFTVTVHLARPHAEFMDAWRSITVMPEHLLGDVPPAELRQHPFGTVCPVGNGPFAFEAHRPGESWSFRANPAFPEELGGRPFIDRYVLRVIAEPSTQMAELLTEGIDIYVSPPVLSADEIEEAPHLRLQRFVTRDYVFIAWNARRPELADPAVRKALTMGIDRSRIVQVLAGGFGRVAHTTVPPFHWAFDPRVEGALSYDPAGARLLLDQAQWRDRDGDGVRENADGEPLSIDLMYHPGPERQQMAEILQAQLLQIGVELVPSVLEYATMVGMITDPERRDFEGVTLAWANEFKLDDRELFHSERSEGPSAFAGTGSAELDRVLDSLQLVVDRAEAIPLWHRYQRMLIEEQPFTFLYFRERLVGVNRRVRGATMDARGEWVSIRDWWVDPAGR